MTPLHTLPLKCAACGGREVELFLFVKRDEAERGLVLAGAFVGAPITSGR